MYDIATYAEPLAALESRRRCPIPVLALGCKSDGAPRKCLSSKLTTLVSFSGCFDRLKNQVIQDVPKDIAVREYNCRRGQCMQDEWETCARRLSASTGELKPFSIH